MKRLTSVKQNNDNNYNNNNYNKIYNVSLPFKLHVEQVGKFGLLCKFLNQHGFLGLELIPIG